MNTKEDEIKTVLDKGETLAIEFKSDVKGCRIVISWLPWLPWPIQKAD